MKYLKRVALVTGLLLAMAPAWSINKCTGADGKVAFQDAPCNGRGEILDVKPAAGRAVPAAAAASGAKRMTEAQRIEGLVTASQQDRRKLELEARLVPEAFNAITAQRAACDQELKALQARKGNASNNLAGATYEVSISSEMTAVATRCGTRNTEVRDDHAALVKECRALGGCK